MIHIRRAGLIFFILILGIFIGSLGAKTALLIVTPLFVFWFMLLDEKSYRRHLNMRDHYEEENHYQRTP